MAVQRCGECGAVIGFCLCAVRRREAEEERVQAPPSRPSCFDCGQDFAARPGVACRAMHLHDPSWRKAKR